jgi:hypothetical protein
MDLRVMVLGDAATGSMVSGHLMTVESDVASLVDGSIMEASSTIVAMPRSDVGR